MGVAHWIGLEVLAVSSIRREIAAAVNDFVVDPVQYKVSGVASVFGRTAQP